MQDWHMYIHDKLYEHLKHRDWHNEKFDRHIVMLTKINDNESYLFIYFFG